MIDATKKAEAVKPYAEAMVQIAIDNAVQSGRGNDITEEIVQSCRDYWLGESEAKADKILTQAGLYACLCNGTFHPSNKHSRRMLETLHSVTLPKTVEATREAVRDLIGRDYCEAMRKQEEDAKEKKRIVREYAESGKRSEYINELKNRVIEGKTIDGDDLYELAKELGISVHPRTAGTLKNRLRSIANGKATATGGKLPYSVWDLFSEVESKVKNLATA